MLPIIKVLGLPEREALVTYVCVNMAALGEPVVPKNNRNTVSNATEFCMIDNEHTGRKLQVQDDSLHVCKEHLLPIPYSLLM